MILAHGGSFEVWHAHPGTWLLIALIGGVYALVLILPFGRHFYALDVPNPVAWLAVVCGAALAIGGLVGTDDRFIPGWALHRFGARAATEASPGS